MSGGSGVGYGLLLVALALTLVLTVSWLAAPESMPAPLREYVCEVTRP